MTEKEMQLKQKQEVQRVAETTKPDKYYVPAVDIFETEEAVTVLAEMPGVSKEGVEIDLEDDTLTLRGKMEPQDFGEETILLQEFETGHYLRKFTVAETIDQAKIDARMSDGLLTLVLPKLAPAAPRKIEVQGG
jgi:HSP20 family protein